MPADRLLLVCVAVVVACLLLGGGTRAGFLSDVIIQLAAIPLLLMGLWRLAGLPSARHARWAAVFCLAVALVPLLQLVPLPPELWTALPNREAAQRAVEFAAADLPWMPLSVSPRATWLAALSLLPPIAIFLATLLLGYRERRVLSLVLVAVGLVGVFLGLVQVAEGPASSLRFFQFTNASEAVGFFANRNHFASALYALTLFTAAWAVDAAAPPAPGQARVDTGWVVPLLASFTVLVVLVAAQAMARSRAGLGLTIAALIGAAALAARDRRNSAGITPARLMLAATALAVVFAAQFTLYRLLERFEDPLRDARVTLARVTTEVAQLYMPFGSGVGTFVPAYALQQRPEDAPIEAYANRAHNDLLELWLESGVVGPALAAIFLIWLLIRALQLWRRSAPGAEVDLALARAAALVIALIIAHSVVDYPLRTAAIMAIMAFACGLLVVPPDAAFDRVFDGDGTGRDRPRGARRAAKSPRSVRSADAPISQHPPDRWGGDIEWPKEWR
jgi:O-antigen ligase